MRRFVSIAAVVALAVVGSGTAGSADMHEEPFEGTLVGQVDIAPAPGCPLGIMTVSDAEGTLTHLGRTVMHSEHCTPADAYNPYGLMTLTADNGDTVEIVYNGFAPYPGPTDESINVEGDLFVVGGTGRFAEAVGGVIDLDWETFGYVGELAFPGYLSDGNFPPGPFETVWEIGPIAIGY